MHRPQAQVTDRVREMVLEYYKRGGMVSGIDTICRSMYRHRKMIIGASVVEQIIREYREQQRGKKNAEGKTIS